MYAVGGAFGALPAAHLTPELPAMPGPLPPTITLSPTLQTTLEHLCRCPSSPHALVRRAQIVVAAATGARTEAIARELGCTTGMVRTWRARWAAEADRLLARPATTTAREWRQAVSALLADAPRPGAPPTFLAEQVVHIVAIACEPLPCAECEDSHWTPTAVARVAVERGVVSAISARTVGRFLGSGRPQTAPDPRLADSPGG
jgi:putative transposase